MSEEITEYKTQPKTSAVAMMASRLSISETKLVEVLKATAFKTCKNDEQFAALMIVANEYKLNPLTKEIYAFPGKSGEVVPIVSIDGWLRIINSRPEMDGMDEEFADDGSWCKVTIWRKDRERPTRHTERLDECRRNTEPWKQHPRRMLKWKTIIQAARIAFGFGGIYDEDEGREVASNMRNVTPEKGLTVRETALDPRADPTNDEPQQDQPTDSSESVTPATGKQKKDRHHRECLFQEIVEKGTGTGKTFWVASFDIGQKLVEMVTWSQTMAENMMTLDKDTTVRITFTVGAKGGYDLEDYEIREVEGGSNE